MGERRSVHVCLRLDAAGGHSSNSIIVERVPWVGGRVKSTPGTAQRIRPTTPHRTPSRRSRHNRHNRQNRHNRHTRHTR